MLAENTISLTSVHQTIFLSHFSPRTKMPVHQIQQVLQDRHQQMLSLAATVISMNYAFTFIANFPAWLLKLPITSELSCDERAKLFKESSKNELLQFMVCTPNRFLEVLQHHLLTASTLGNTWHSNVSGGRKAEQGTFSEHWVSQHHIKTNSLYQVYFPFCVDVCC